MAVMDSTVDSSCCCCTCRRQGQQDRAVSSFAVQCAAVPPHDCLLCVLSSIPNLCVSASAAGCIAVHCAAAEGALANACQQQKQPALLAEQCSLKCHMVLCLGADAKPGSINLTLSCYGSSSAYDNPSQQHQPCTMPCHGAAKARTCYSLLRAAAALQCRLIITDSL